MATTFKIPTIFTAVDKATSVVKGIGKNIHGLALKAEAGVARMDRGFRKLTPVLSETQKNLFSAAKAAAIAGAIFAGVSFSIDSLKEYETAVQSFRVIVGGTDKEFKPYQDAINQVAKDTKKSAVDTAAAFEKIAGLNSKFAETSEGISNVAKSAIILSKASRDDLGKSAESLVGIMNQFSLGADQATRTIDVLAAGTAVGASSITQTADAFVNFGSVASSANISLEESVALVQTLGKYSIFGAEAGNKLKGSILRIQKAGVGYQSGLFNINDALAEAKSKLDKLKTAKQKDAFLNKLFGAENISTGRTLLSNIDLFKEYTKGVKQTGAAQDAANINSNTLTTRLEELKAGWVNLITGSKESTTALNTAKDAVAFLTNNLDTIVSVGSKVVLTVLAIKAALIVARVATIAYSVVTGIMTAITGGSAIALRANSVALAAYSVVTKIATASQWLLNAAMSANPIGLVILAIVALVALVTVIIKKWNEWGAALTVFLGPLGLIISIIQSIRRNWDMIVATFKNGSFIDGIKAIGRVIMDAILMPVQQLLGIIAKLTGAKWAENAVKGIGLLRNSLNVNTTTDESGNPLVQAAPQINPKKAEQDAVVQRMESTKTEKQNVNIEINDKTGNAKISSDDSITKVKLTSTRQF